jgi:hypothetical protein
MAVEARGLYDSPNGDRWYLVREPRSERVFIRHEPAFVAVIPVSVLRLHRHRPGLSLLPVETPVPPSQVGILRLKKLAVSLAVSSIRFHACAAAKRLVRFRQGAARVSHQPRDHHRCQPRARADAVRPLWRRG